MASLHEKTERVEIQIRILCWVQMQKYKTQWFSHMGLVDLEKKIVFTLQKHLSLSFSFTVFN
jgi:hypothetical protein